MGQWRSGHNRAQNCRSRGFLCSNVWKHMPTWIVWGVDLAFACDIKTWHDCEIKSDYDLSEFVIHIRCKTGYLRGSRVVQWPLCSAVKTKFSRLKIVVACSMSLQYFEKFLLSKIAFIWTFSSVLSYCYFSYHFKWLKILLYFRAQTRNSFSFFVVVPPLNSMVHCN